ncbi:MAG TPA: type II toxin-antitoxin system prevent-host-death family antitoxin [Thermoleophilaceae bacterium]|nr:type II toxin-antitoxin system prevent-host-death family antitoxin [Thermoleophilaceae bacterium]
MASKVGIRELRQNLSRHLERVKRGEALVVTERGKEVARLVPSGAGSDRYRELAERFGATVPTERLEDIVARLERSPRPAGTTDAFLAESRRERV